VGNLLDTYLGLIENHLKQHDTLFRLIKSIIINKVEENIADKRVLIDEINRIGMNPVKLKNLFILIYDGGKLKIDGYRNYRLSKSFVESLKQTLGEIDVKEN
jgi:hypothetical protein